MDDLLLSISDIKEGLSSVYAEAVATRVGYQTAKFNQDRDGIDLQIGAGGSMRPSIQIQLKATVNLSPAKEGYFHFALKQRNYELLRVPTSYPRLLVVLDLPKNSDAWLTITADELVMRRRAYWLSLRGAESTNNKSTTTVKIPTTNVFDVAGLQSLMQDAREGRI